MRLRWKILSALLLLMLAALLWAWLFGPAWLAGFNAEQQEMKHAFTQQGREFGQRSDVQACLDRTLSEFDQCGGYDCTLKHDYFLKACLEAAAPTEGFCEGVPAFRETPTEDDKTWARHSCWDKDIRHEGCRLLLRQQQYWCSGAAAPDAAAAD